MIPTDTQHREPSSLLASAALRTRCSQASPARVGAFYTSLRPGALWELTRTRAVDGCR